ncbi:MAG: thioredoxin family protein [Verrucomicrobiae bacterium]|nr:thioredoxin family protein [Verrucomicrobiae bacterium]
MKTFLLSAFVLAMIVTTQADTIRLANGKELSGTVTGYGNMTFDVTLENGTETRQPAAVVKSIEFAPRQVKIELRGRPPVEGNITSFENGTFVIQQEGGKVEKVPAMLVSNATFGGSGKKVMVLLGGGPVDLKKALAPQKVTILVFYLDSSGPSRALMGHLEKLCKEDPEVFLRKVDVVKISSQVSKQFDIKSVPITQVYDRAGNRVGEVKGNSMDAITTLVRVAKEGQKPAGQ